MGSPIATTASGAADFQLPDDGWYAIETPGEHPNPTAGIIQVIDSTAVNSMVREFNAEAEDFVNKTGRRFPGLCVDIEHFKHNPEKETRAYGWLTGLQNRKGTLYGQIKWTATGQAAVEGGEYRFFSTEYDPSDVVVLNSATPKRVRPMKLDGLTLTNQPNNPGVPITNRAQPGAEPPKVSQALVSAVEDEQARHDNILAPLKKWFEAVSQVKKTAKTGLGGNLADNISFQYAWGLAKTYHPDEYAAAHKLLCETPAGDDSADVQAAGQQLTMVVNRIARDGKLDLPAAYRFTEQQIPALFNRLKPAAQRITNRQRQENSPRALQKAAVAIFNRQVQAEINATGHPHSMVFSRIMNREPVIGRFASGLIAPADVLVNHPGIWLRLQAEND